MVDERVLTVDEAAGRLRVHRETVRRMLRGGTLRGTRLGGKKAGWRIAASDVERVLVEGAAPPPPEHRAESDQGRSASLARAQELAARYRAEGDVDEAEHWERIAAGIAAAVAAE